MSRLQEALDRAFPVFQMGGISGAMYPADEGEGQGWAISNEDWEVVSRAIRELIEDPVAFVRRGVESGTIKGEEARICATHGAKAVDDEECVVWLAVGGDSNTNCRIESRLIVGSPVSDGGSET